MLKSLVAPSLALLVIVGCGTSKPAASAAAPPPAATESSEKTVATSNTTAEPEAPPPAESAETGSTECGACEDDKCHAKCEALCEKKDKDACTAVVDHYALLSHDLLGAAMDAKEGAPKQAAEKKLEAAKAKHLEYAKLGCDVGSGRACSEYGSLAWSGQAGEVSEKKLAISFAAFKKACDLGEMLGCSDLGRAYLDGEGTAKDAGKAAEAWGRSCVTSRYGCSDLRKLVIAKNKQALAALDMIKKECAKAGGKGTACDAQKEVEKK